MALQPDGKILVGGWVCFGGQCNLARLNPDGTLDSGFAPRLAGRGDPEIEVYALGVQPDGKILVSGAFTLLNGQPWTNFARLNPDGTRDTSFTPNSYTYLILLQADGKIEISGTRLNADGTRDSSFNPSESNLDGTPYAIFWAPYDGAYPRAVTVQPDGKILIGGMFTNVHGQARNHIARLNPDGTLDAGFNPGMDQLVSSLALQTDGKILVGGGFRHVAGQSRAAIARLNADGTLDESFNPAPPGTLVRALAVQPADGKIVAVGDFGIALLNNTEPPTQSLSHDGSTITWLRGGTSPEVWRTTFDYSVDGDDWVSAGASTRIPGGWQVTGLSVPATARVRARGFITGSENYSWSSWFVETILTPARLGLKPAADSIDLWWSASVSNLDLFSTSSLMPPVNWQPVVSPKGTNGTIIQAYVPRTNGVAFFQLRPSP